MRTSLIFTVAFLGLSRAQHYSATYLPSNAPPKSENGQAGTNQCGTTSSQDSMCQNAFINSVEDFCLFAPPTPGPQSTIGDTERVEVSWCTQAGHGTRVIPAGAITGAHFVQTPDFVQVTGVGDLTKLNIPSGDEGGELDPHGADGNGNPIGGLVFGSSFGQLQQYHEWTNFMSSTEFCFRACKDAPRAPTFCQHIYDVMGCMWNMPANYDAGTFEDCQGNSGEPMGVYGASTFHQGDPVTPPPHPIPASSNCKAVATVGGGTAVDSNPPSGATPTPPPSNPSSGASSAPTPGLSSSPAIASSSAALSSGSSGSSANQSTPSATLPRPSIPSTPSSSPPASSSGTTSAATRVSVIAELPLALLAAAFLVHLQ